MKAAILVSLFALIPGMRSSGFVRVTVTDEEAVAQAQWIVIGHFKEGSLMRSQKDRYQTSASAVLVVSKVVKGASAIKEIPIEIAYGLTPVVGGEIRYVDPMTGEGHPDEHVKAGEVRIYDTGNSLYSPTPFTGNLNQDQIWLLRASPEVTEKAPGKLRVSDPEDIQPLSKEKVLLGVIGKKGIEGKR